MRTGRRHGIGVLAAVLVVLLLLIIIAFVQAFGRSSTSRTVLRVSDIRSAFEVGESALAEAVVALRTNLDSGRPTPECADDWRALVAGSFQTPARPAGVRRIVPRFTRSTFQTQQLSANVEDVRVEIIDVFRPEGEPGKLAPPLQGVIELGVAVEVNRMTSRVRKVVRQRRSFHLSWPPELPGGGDPASPTTQVTILANPLGTVVE